MLGWFQSLMPTQGRFFDQFESHAATLVAGAEALSRLFNDGEHVDAYVAEIVRLEHEADDLTRDVLQDVRKVFVTPFDRSAIIDLIGVMDDAIDQMNQTANAIALYDYRDFEPEMREMAGIIVKAAGLIATAIPLLRGINKHGDRLNGITEEIVRIEGEGDAIHDKGLKAIYGKFQDQPMRFVVGREILNHLERVIDRFEDVANEIQGLVIDHA